MAQFYSVELGSGVPGARNYPVSGVGLGGRTSHWARAEFTLATALATTDVLDLFDLPPRARNIDGFVKSDDLYTNGTPPYAFNVGTAATPALFFAAATAPQAGTVTRMSASTAIDFLTTGKTRVKLVPSANAATFATGNVVVMIEYLVEEPK